MSARLQNKSQLTAVLISPHRELALQFAATLPETRAFQILAELKTYPSAQTLEVRLRQHRPDVILLDLATDLGTATELIQSTVGLTPPVQVVGLHLQNDSQAILQSLRAGAAEFLHAPFDHDTQRDAAMRLRRLCVPESTSEPVLGRVLAFCSSKPGSGASTLATQTAFAMQRLTGKRMLLADFDLTGGTIGFYLKLSHTYSLVDALQHAEHLDSSLWTSLAVNHGGLDILQSPATPYAEPVDPGRLRVLIERARQRYEWVVLDLPAVFSRTSLMAIAESETAFMVSTNELPSLHLTRKAMGMLDKIGFPRERVNVVVNRVDRRDDIGPGQLEKLFGCPVYATLPNDYFSLHRVVTLGQPLGPDGDLGKGIDKLAGRICGIATEGRKAAPAAPLRTALSQA